MKTDRTKCHEMKTVRPTMFITRNCTPLNCCADTRRLSLHTLSLTRIKYMIKLVPRSKPFLPVAKKSVNAVYGNNGRVFQSHKRKLIQLFYINPGGT